ncbi:MAG: FAD binding domain-containing protein, partial [bacterium]
LSPCEILVKVKFKPLPDFKFYYTKFGKRNAMAISVVSLATGIKLKEKIEEARLALGAVAPTPLRARKTEEFLKGKKIESEVLEEASEILLTEINPISDIRASKEYRLELTRSLFFRALSEINFKARSL